MQDVLNFLNAIRPLSKELTGHLQAIVKSQHVPKRGYLLKAGETSRKICFITKGLLRALYIHDGEEVSAWFMQSGDVIVSIESFYAQIPSKEYIQAVEETEIYYLEYGELENVYEQFPEFNFHGRVLTIKYLTLWAAQLYALRRQNAKARYEWLLENRPDIILQVPAKFIASYLGINEVTLSRIKQYIANKQR